MVQNAEQHAAEDKARRELVEARNHADGLIHATEKSIGEHGDKVDPAEKTQIEDDIAALRTALEGEDAEAITTATNTLTQSAMKLGEAVYKAQAEAEGAAAGDDGEDDGADSGTTDDTVVDAEFEEVDDDDSKKSGAA